MSDNEEEELDFDGENVPLSPQRVEEEREEVGEKPVDDEDTAQQQPDVEGAVATGEQPSPMRFTQFSPTSSPNVGEKRTHDADNGDEDATRELSAAEQAIEQQQPQRQAPRRPKLDIFANLADQPSQGSNGGGDVDELDDEPQQQQHDMPVDQAAAAAGGAMSVDDAAVGAQISRIWGTDIETSVVEDKFRTFLRTFCEVDNTLEASFNATSANDGAVSVDAIKDVAQRAARDADDADADRDDKKRKIDEGANAAAVAAAAAADDDETTPSRRPLYPALLEHMARTQSIALNINCAYLRRFDMKLYQQVIEYPSEMLGLFDSVLTDELRSVCTRLGIVDPPPHPKVRPFALAAIAPLRALDPTNIDQLVAVRGMITRVSTVIPEMKMSFHRCVLCEASVVQELDAGSVVTPTTCRQCSGRECMDLIHNRCLYTDKQLVKLQETPDAIPDGDTPHTLTLISYDALVDVGRPGDRVEVTGVFRAVPSRTGESNRRSVKSVFKTYIDVVHMKKSDARRMTGDDDPDDGGDVIDADVNTSIQASSTEFVESQQPDEQQQQQQQESQQQQQQQQEPSVFDSRINNNALPSFRADDATDQMKRQKIAEIRALAQRPDIFDLLVRSLAPSIWQMDDVKKGILCLLFGGVNKNFAAQGVGKTRGDINVLLCGDPGTSKSQLLSYVHKLAPRGIYTSGRGSSAVGLTAYISRDVDTGETVLESGALVLSDRGVCCIDEFDKMTDSTRAVLHEVMEQQTVSVAKAGIVCTLNARTSILASANPIESRYNPHRSVVENLDLPPTLLSRFDLIYLILDKPNLESDKRLARHIIQLYWSKPPPQPDVLSIELMTRYISYARRYCHPRITADAAQALVRRYVQMRRAGASQRTVTATPRQLESLIRLSEALARMQLAPEVLKSHVDEAGRLLFAAMQTAAIDPRTGRVDMDLITTGRSAAQRTHLDELTSELRRVLAARQSIRFQPLLMLMQQQSSVEVTATELRDALQQLQSVI